MNGRQALAREGGLADPDRGHRRKCRRHGSGGAAKQQDPHAQVTVFTELADVAYSPCGIPYVHGREIPDFDRLVLQSSEYYAEQGLDIRYETRVESVSLASREVTVRGEGQVPFDRLVLATGFEYETPDIPGTGLKGIYYVRDLHAARRWDKTLDKVKTAVVAEAQPIGVEMATALARRGIETHLVDPHPWPMAEIADPDIMAPVEESWRELGVHVHLNTAIEALTGPGKVESVRTPAGELPTDIVVMGTKKLPNTRLAQEAGIKTGSTGGIIVGPGMATSADGVCGRIRALPRRPIWLMRWPVTRQPATSGDPATTLVSRMCTDMMHRPGRTLARPRRSVSASGSSGTGQPPSMSPHGHASVVCRGPCDLPAGSQAGWCRVRPRPVRAAVEPGSGSRRPVPPAGHLRPRHGRPRSRHGRRTARRAPRRPHSG
jgi:thioredoxin reductase